MRRPTRRSHGEGCQRPVPPSGARTKMAGRLRRGTGDSMHAQGSGCNTGSPVGGAHAPTENPRGPVWAGRVADRPVVPGKRGNACGGKGPWFESDAGKETGTQGTGASLQAPITVRKFRMAPHAESEASSRWPRSGGREHGRGRHSGRVGSRGGSPRRSPGRRAFSGRTAAERSGTSDGADGAASRVRAHDLEREPSAGNPHAGFDERGEETWSRWRLRHRHCGESRRQQLLPPPSTSAPLLDSTVVGRGTGSRIPAILGRAEPFVNSARRWNAMRVLSR